jgi:hypothetical protein
VNLGCYFELLFVLLFAADDSGSMAFEDNGERVEDLKMIGSKVRASAAAGMHAQLSQAMIICRALMYDWRVQLTLVAFKHVVLHPQ